jgi:hypothetical protein
MILDKLFQFTGGPGAPTNGDGLNDAITVAVAGQDSSFTVDIGVGLQTTSNTTGAALPPPASGAGARDLGIGDDPALKIMVEVVSIPTGGTNLFVTLLGAPDNGSGAPGAFSVYATGPTIALAQLTQGSRLMDFDLPRPPAGVAMPRYLKLQYTSTGTFASLLLRGNVVLDRFDQVVGATGLLSGYVPGITVPN